MTVVIPSRNDALVKRAIRSITRTHDSTDQIRIVVVDDGLGSRTPYLDHMIYVDGRKPFCFASNVNLGISARASKSDVFIMNDDTFFVSHNGLAELSRAGADRPQLGVLTPVFARPERTASQRLGYLDPDSGLYIEREAYLTFAAVYIPHKTLEIVGLLDEQFTGYGFEDNDYCMRVVLSGLEMGVLPSAVMAHGDGYGRASTTYRERTDFADLVKANRQRFLNKWTRDIFGLSERQHEGIRLMTSFI